MGIGTDRVIDAERVCEEFFCPVCGDLIHPADATEVGG